MKKIIFLIIISIPLISNFGQVNERLRQKLENLPENKALNKEYDIYCIPSVLEVYLNSGFNPYWTSKTQKDAFISIIENCEKEGLQPGDYHLSAIIKVLKDESIEGKANLDIILTDAFLLYSSHLLAGKVNPKNIDPEWHVVKTDNNPIKYFYSLLNQDIESIIDNLTPKTKNYLGLKEQLNFYRQLHEDGYSLKIESGPALKPGVSDERIPKIREALKALTFLKDDQNSQSIVYDETMKKAVIEFQKRTGLEALGLIGNQSIEMLNTPPSERIKSIIVNLERIRWLPQEVPNYYLIVNIANFELDVYEDNHITRNHKAIVGKNFRKTPVFSSTIQYLVFNPTWTVPPTILRNDIIPEIRKNINYLTQKNINVFDAKGNKLNVDSINWNNNKVFSYTYRQEPGKANALGAVKFMFPNEYNVYLHDTPARELFEKTERALSSGCIRVEKPLELAEYILRDQAGYSKEKIQNIIASNLTQTVILKRKLDIYLIYLTAWVNDNGQINFRKDIYSRDKILYEALQEKPVYDVN